MGTLEGRIIVVTGAGSGIGAETAKVAAEQGATVIGWDLHAGTNVDAVDVGSWDAVAAAAQRVGDKHGRIDGLVNRPKMSIPVITAAIST